MSGGYGSVRRSELRFCRRVVVKVGTGVVTSSEGFLAIGRLGALVEQIFHLVRQGKEVVLVTSGAVGLGKLKLNKQALLSASFRAHLGSAAQGKIVPVYDDKAAAAAGQSVLMSLYETLFQQFDVQVSQVLLMDEDFQHAHKRTVFRNTMESLLRLGVVPILNENDVMTSRTMPLVDENKAIFWDNDSLACLVASEIQADLVVLLSDVDGLYRRLPAAGEAPEIVSTFHMAEKYTLGKKSRVGRGGMQAKIDAALGAVQRGVKAVVVASGYRPNTLEDVVAGKNVGTLFGPQSLNMTKVEDASDHFADDSAAKAAILARRASRALQKESSEVRRRILHEIASALVRESDMIINVNREDIDAAASSSLSPALVSRLELSKTKLETLANGIRKIADSEEPLGNVVKKTELSPGLVLEQQTTSIGVLLIIFESRPDALPQIAALSIRSGNGLLVKGGQEALRTNTVLHNLIVECVNRITQGRVGRELIGFVKSRDDVKSLLQLDKFIDLVIPRGSSKLVSYIQNHTKIPVLGHAEGICHVFVDEHADLRKAIRIVLDSKTDYPAACNALETLLLHRSWISNGKSSEFLNALISAKVTIYGGPKAAKELGIQPAESLRHEYSALAVTIEIVDNLNDAISFINEYGSGHTDAIVTEDKEAAEKFMREVDSACVFHNSSTRFSDGYRFGLGAEVGISTGRIHARGPVGVEGLLSTKWQLRSSSEHCVSDFAGKGSTKLEYTHKNLLKSKI